MLQKVLPTAIAFSLICACSGEAPQGNPDDFDNEGVDLEATDVEGAIRELAQRVHDLEAELGAASPDTPWSSVTEKPAGFADDVDNDLLAGLGCAQGEVASMTSVGWSCATDQKLSASEVVAYATESAINLNSGSTIGGVAISTAATAADVGALSLDGGTLTGSVTTPGLILAPSSGDCTTAGTLVYDATLLALRFCDGSAWHNLSPLALTGAGVPGDPYTFADGSAADSCKVYFDKSGPALLSGTYALNDDSGIYEAWCDQVTDGGGWTLVAKLTGTGTDLNRTDVARWRNRQYLGGIDSLAVEDALGPSYEYVPFNDVMIRSLADPARNLGWRHAQTHTSMFAVVDAGVPIVDGVRMFGAIGNLDYTSFPERNYHRACPRMHYGFLMADWNYNVTGGIAGHAGLNHGHVGAVVGASLWNPDAAFGADYTDFTATYCISDFGLGGGYYTMASGNDLYNINAHWWGAGNESTADWNPHGLFVR